MLTLKAPIQLHIAQGLTGNMDTFSQRILGNYSLLGARYTPKDLLFLLTAPVELPEDLGGMTTLVSQQNTVDVSSVTMDVVNNVVNRILLDGTEQFTYQDQVYITSVLNKLGITNTEQFMQQVRQLRLESESTLQLTELYRSEVERLLQREKEGAEILPLPMQQQKEDEMSAQPQDPRVTMSLEILQRLDTTNLYETIHSFQRDWSGGVERFQHNEFRLAEHLRFSNAVSLAEIKQQVYQQPQVHLLHHLNQYETGVLLDAPKNEEDVLAQAAAAALVTAVDNTVTEVLNRPQLKREQWLQIGNAIWQTAENTITRFDTYHQTYQQPAAAPQPNVQTAWNYYAQELMEYQTLYQQLYPKAAEHGRAIGVPPATREQLTHLTRLTESETLLQQMAQYLDETSVLNRASQELQAWYHTLYQQIHPQAEEVIRGGAQPVTEELLTHLTTLADGDQQLQVLEQYLEGASAQYHTALELQETLNRYQSLYTQVEEAGRTAGLPPITREQLIHLTRLEEGDTQLEELEQFFDSATIQKHTAQELQETLNQYRTIYTQTAEARRLAGQPAVTQEQLTRLTQLTEGDIHLQQVEQYLESAIAQYHTAQELRESLSQYRNLYHQTVEESRAAGQPVVTQEQLRSQWNLFTQAVEASHAAELPPIVREQLIHLTKPAEGDVNLEELEQYLLLEAQQTRAAVQDSRKETESAARKMVEQRPQDTVLHRETSHRESEQLRERLTQETLQTSAEHTLQVERLLQEQKAQTPEAAPEVFTQPVPLTPREAEEQAPEILLEEMNRIDQHNRTLLQTVQQNIRQKEPTAPIGSDTQRTMRESLRALENPELVLREIYEKEPEEKPRPALTAEQEAILRQADPTTRAMYEKILTYQNDPERALEQGLVRAVSMGALQAELQQAAQEQPVQLEHPMQPEQPEEALLPEQTAELLRQMEQRPIRQRMEEAGTLPPEVSMIPRQQAEPDQQIVYQEVPVERASQKQPLVRDLLDAAGQDAIQTEIRQVMRDDAPTMAHPTAPEQTEAERLPEQLTGLLEQLHRTPGARTIETPIRQPETIHFVHKQAASDVTEELLEQMEERTRSVVRTTTEEEVTQRNVHQVDVKQIENKMVAQTTEDITELVNRTLARQMRTISDQVYKQMEKRLQSERSRRGRF